MTAMPSTDTSSLPAPPPELLRGASLFLDFDGTLVEIAARPDAVLVGQQLHELLGGLNAGLEGRVAIVSGRAAADISGMLKDLHVGGSHGAELYWSDGRTNLSPPRDTTSAAFRGKIAALQQRHPNVLLEEKPFGFAFHFRQAPDAETDCVALAGQLSVQTGLALQTGKKVIELRPRGADKGNALRAFMAQPPMMTGRPIFVGDDDTDEAGFAAAAELGGAGILVGPARPTAARYRLDGVEPALHWLEQARAMLP
jgi:trehalose 6-phosphate phosphatase